MYNNHTLIEFKNFLSNELYKDNFNIEFVLEKISKTEIAKKHIINFLDNYIYETTLTKLVCEKYSNDFLKVNLVKEEVLNIFYESTIKSISSANALKKCLEDVSTTTGIPSDTGYIHRILKINENKFKEVSPYSELNYDLNLFSHSRDAGKLREQDAIYKLIDIGVILVNSYIIGDFTLPCKRNELDSYIYDYITENNLKYRSFVEYNSERTYTSYEKILAHSILKDIYTLESLENGIFYIKDLDIEVYSSNQTISNFIYTCLNSSRNNKTFGIVTHVDDKIILREVFVSKKIEEIFSSTSLDYNPRYVNNINDVIGRFLNIDYLGKGTEIINTDYDFISNKDINFKKDLENHKELFYKDLLKAKEDEEARKRLEKENKDKRCSKDFKELFDFFDI